MNLLVLLTHYATPAVFQGGATFATSEAPALVQVVSGTALFKRPGGKTLLLSPEEWCLCSERLPASVEAVTCVSARVIPIARAHAVWPHIQRQGVTASLQSQLVELQADLRERSTAFPQPRGRRADAKARVVATLEQHGGLRNAWLASLAGVSRASVTRCLNELLEEGRCVKQGTRLYTLAG